MDWDSLETRAVTTTGTDLVGEATEAPVDPDALPEVDIDTKAYFREVADKIGELEELGHGRKKVEGADEEEDEDDRPLLLRSSLESLSGHEIPLAGDPDTSIILERLLFAMDDFARRVLGDRFMGQYDKLVRHRNASHVLQTLFTLAGETVDREVSFSFHLHDSLPDSSLADSRNHRPRSRRLHIRRYAPHDDRSPSLRPRRAPSLPSDSHLRSIRFARRPDSPPRFRRESIELRRKGRRAIKEVENVQRKARRDEEFPRGWKRSEAGESSRTRRVCCRVQGDGDRSARRAGR